MKHNSGTIKVKNSTIVCDDWRQLLDLDQLLIRSDMLLPFI